MVFGCSSNVYRARLLLAFLFAGLGGIPVAFAQTADQITEHAIREMSSGNLEAAISALRSGARRFPEDRHIQYNLGLALVRKGRLGEAVPALTKAAHDPALAAEAHFLLALDYFQSKQYASAITELRRLQNSNHSERVLYMLEESARLTGRVDEAKAAFHELLTRYPDSGWTHYLLGTAYEDEQKLEEAVAEYQLAFARDPSIPNTAFAVGYCYWREQQNDLAREWLQKEAAHGCHSLAFYYLGEIARSDDDFSKAEASYRRALQCDPADAAAHLRLGTVFESEKRYHEAIEQLRESIRLQPNDARAHYRLAAVYRSLGRAAESRAELSKVHQLQAGSAKGLDPTSKSQP